MLKYFAFFVLLTLLDIDVQGQTYKAVRAELDSVHKLNVTDSIIIIKNDSTFFWPKKIVGYYSGDMLLYTKRIFIEKEHRITQFQYYKTNNKWRNPFHAIREINSKSDTVIVYKRKKRNFNLVEFRNSKRIRYKKNSIFGFKVIPTYTVDETTQLRFMKEGQKGQTYNFKGEIIDLGSRPPYCGVTANGQIIFMKLNTKHPILGDSVLLSINCPEFLGRNFLRKKEHYQIEATSELDTKYIYNRGSGEFAKLDIPVLYSQSIVRLEK